MTVKRIDAVFARTRSENRPAFVAYLMASDPDHDTAFACMKALAKAGADLIELGFPFTDPMADGPSIQGAALRALTSGGSVTRTLETVARFRQIDQETPVILMGYANPLHRMGYAPFASSAAEAEADGVIVVDLPPEEDEPLRVELDARSIATIRLATPTTSPDRMAKVVNGASGFIYYVSVAGVTGRGAGSEDSISAAVAKVRAASDLPVVVGFGVRTPQQAASFARVADGVVIGSALVDEVAAAVQAKHPESAPERISVVAATLSNAIRSARQSGVAV